MRDKPYNTQPYNTIKQLRKNNKQLKEENGKLKEQLTWFRGEDNYWLRFIHRGAMA